MISCRTGLATVVLVATLSPLSAQNSSSTGGICGVPPREALLILREAGMPWAPCKGWADVMAAGGGEPGLDLSSWGSGRTWRTLKGWNQDLTVTQLGSWAQTLRAPERVASIERLGATGLPQAVDALAVLLDSSDVGIAPAAGKALRRLAERGLVKPDRVADWLQVGAKQAAAISVAAGVKDETGVMVDRVASLVPDLLLRADTTTLGCAALALYRNGRSEQVDALLGSGAKGRDRDLAYQALADIAGDVRPNDLHWLPGTWQSKTRADEPDALAAAGLLLQASLAARADPATELASAALLDDLLAADRPVWLRVHVADLIARQGLLADCRPRPGGATLGEHASQTPAEIVASGTLPTESIWWLVYHFSVPCALRAGWPLPNHTGILSCKPTAENTTCAAQCRAIGKLAKERGEHIVARYVELNAGTQHAACGVLLRDSSCDKAWDQEFVLVRLAHTACAEARTFARCVELNYVKPDTVGAIDVLALSYSWHNGRYELVTTASGAVARNAFARMVTNNLGHLNWKETDT